MITRTLEASTADREIVTTRLIKAPRELVFDAFTSREHVGEWWGPLGFRTTTSEMDVRPGGTWRFIMHGPDGTDYPNRIDYIEVVRPSLLSYAHGDDGKGDHSFHSTITFEEEAGGTRLTMKAVFPTAEGRRHVVENHNALEGGRQTIDRLEAFLAGGA